MSETITRKQAREKGELYYFTGNSCKHGHTSLRRVSNGSCVECYNIWKSNNRKWTNEYYNDWHQKTKQERHSRIRKVGRKASRKHRKAHKPLYAAHAASRRAIRNRAIPPWFESEQVKHLYEKRDELNTRYGTSFTVDHVIPLVSDTVCGLHCWDNLQLLETVDNIQKGNTYQQDW